MRLPPLICLCFFPGVFLSSKVTGACPVTTDLIMRVNVRTTTTTIAVKTHRSSLVYVVDMILRSLAFRLAQRTNHCVSLDKALKKQAQCQESVGLTIRKRCLLFAGAVQRAKLERLAPAGVMLGTMAGVGGTRDRIGQERHGQLPIKSDNYRPFKTIP